MQERIKDRQIAFKGAAHIEFGHTCKEVVVRFVEYGRKNKRVEEEVSHNFIDKTGLIQYREDKDGEIEPGFERSCSYLVWIHTQRSRFFCYLRFVAAMFLFVFLTPGYLSHAYPTWGNRMDLFQPE